jgi:hypothetical protein
MQSRCAISSSAPPCSDVDTASLEQSRAARDTVLNICSHTAWYSPNGCRLLGRTGFAVSAADETSLTHRVFVLEWHLCLFTGAPTAHLYDTALVIAYIQQEIQAVEYTGAGSGNGRIG